jgi:hypothetical protein
MIEVVRSPAMLQELMRGQEVCRVVCIDYHECAIAKLLSQFRMRFCSSLVVVSLCMLQCISQLFC